MRELLDRLTSRGVPLAIVTGKGQGSIDISLEELGLTASFDPVMAGSPQRSIKWEAMAAVANHWEIPPGDIVSFFVDR